MLLPNATITLTGAVVSFVLYLVISTFYTSIRNAKKAGKLRCEEPPFEKNRWPLGIDNLLRSLAADRNHQFPVDLIKRFDELGCHTYRYQVLGGFFQTSLTVKTTLAMLILLIRKEQETIGRQIPGISNTC